jgi:uncharacterized membrane protein
VLTIILGFATSLVYGFADFFGALASRKIQPVTVTFLAGVVGAGFVALLSISVGAEYSTSAITWGLIAGFASAIAMSALYAALALGPISVVSPLSAVVMAIVPMCVGFIQGDRFSGLGFVALAAILIAVFLVGFVPAQDVRLPSLRATLLGVVAGLGMGTVLICADQAPVDSGLATVIVLRTTAAALLGLATAFIFFKNPKSTKPRIGAGIWTAVALTGIFDASANVFFLLATRLGSLTVVGVLVALYPLGTIILARIFLHERLAKSQMAGILLALGGSALLAIA